MMLHTLGWDFPSFFVNNVAYTRFLPIPMAAQSKAEGLLPLACWNCRFDSRRLRECLSVVSVVCYQVEVSPMGRKLGYRGPFLKVFFFHILHFTVYRNLFLFYPVSIAI
jgi:hypothetical protein